MLYVNMSLPGDASTMLGCFLSFDIFLVFFGALVSAGMYNFHHGFSTGKDGDDEDSGKIRGYYVSNLYIYLSRTILRLLNLLR